MKHQGAQGASMRLQDAFAHFSRTASGLMGHPVAFLIAVSVVLIWALSGPLFGFSSNWQLVINTGTTIVTFLVVFLIQNTQNRDSRAIHLKLDAIIDAFDQIREDMVAVEYASEKELEEASEEYQKLREEELAEEVTQVAKEATHVAREAGTVAAEAGDIAHEAREVAENAGDSADGAPGSTGRPVRRA